MRSSRIEGCIIRTIGTKKTTISRLLFAVKVKGIDVGPVIQKSLHEMIGIGPEATNFFNGIICANAIAWCKYCMCKEKFKWFNSELNVVAQSAQLIELVRVSPEEWDTLVGDKVFLKNRELRLSSVCLEILPL